MKLKTNIFNKWIGDFQLLLLTLPGVILLFIFAYIPMPGLILAFKKFIYAKGIMGSPWVGLDNFRFLFMSDTAWKITSNTILYNLAFIVFGNVLSICLALICFEISKRMLVKTYQTIIIFPNFVSWVVGAFVFYVLLNPQYGLINNILNSIGRESINWYYEPKYWPVILIFASLWKTAGISSILYFSALMSINSEYYEAARIDGATKLQMSLHISLPFLYPMITLFVILGIGGMIRADFGLFYNVTQDIPLLYPATDVIDTYVYRALRKVGDTGMAAAAGFYQSIVGFLLILISNAVVRKISPDNSVF